MAERKGKSSEEPEVVTSMEPCPAPCPVSPGTHNIGIQCCFNPITQRNVAVQTDRYKPKLPEQKNPVPRASFPEPCAPVHASSDKVSHDHSYAMRAPPDIVFPTFDADSFTIPLPSLEQVKNVTVDGHESDVDDDDDDDDVDEDNEQLDPLWQTPDDEVLTDDDMVSPEDELDGCSPDGEKKYLVFGSCPDKLLKRCQRCGDVIIQQERKTVGSMLSISVTCHSGHTEQWKSQPVVKKKPLGNLLLAASILFTGNTFASISRLASCLNLQFFSESVFYDTQLKYLFPVINKAWEDESRNLPRKLSI